MTQPVLCAQCGSEIPDGSPAGLCPKCLMLAGLESQRPGDPKLSPTQPSPPTGASGFVPPTAEELAARFPQLEILELLGRGGMGAVYKARQPGLDRLVALKILPPEIGSDPAFAERFTREARALARLSQPNIVAVYDFGHTSDGLFYFLMEYVDGVNLRQAIQSGCMSPKEALAIVPQICDALQFAHDEGIVHRDIKPENVLVDKRGRVKIADFGLAKLLGQAPGDVCLTATQQVMGTLRYMAPEQMEGTKAVDHRADIYSLGVVFYELLTGEVPVGRFAPPSKKVQIDVRLDEVVLRAMEEKPEQRYQQVSEVKARVEAISEGPLQAPSPAVSPSGVALPQMLAVAMGLVLGMLLATIGVLLVPAAILFRNTGPGVLGGLLGSALGCLGGGLGSLAGSWNTYRQLRGQTDWMKMTRWTGLDSALAVYGLFGLVLLLGGAFAKAIVTQTVDSMVIASSIWAVLLLGGLVFFQAAIFLMFRMPFILSQMSEGALGRVSLRVAITGLLLPVLLLVAGAKLLSALHLTTDQFNACAIVGIIACMLLGVGLTLLALGFGIAGRRTTSGKAGIILSLLYWVLVVLAILSLVRIPRDGGNPHGLRVETGPATGGSSASATSAASAKKPEITAADVLRKMGDKYAALSTFTASGQVVSEATPAAGDTATSDRTTFTLTLARPEFYRITWTNANRPAITRRGAAWFAGDGHKVMIAGKVGALLNRETALALAPVSKVVALTVPSLFFKDDANGFLQSLKNPTLLPKETVDTVACHVVAADWGGRKVTLWITEKDWLLKRMQSKSDANSRQATTPATEDVSDESLRKMLKTMSHDSSPDAVNKMKKQVADTLDRIRTGPFTPRTTTTTYETIKVNEVMIKEDFEFSASDLSRPVDDSASTAAPVKTSPASPSVPESKAKLSPANAKRLIPKAASKGK